MRQEAPDPTELFDLVARVRYREGWRFALVDIERDEDHGRGTAGGLTLDITTKTANSYHQRVCDSCRSTVTDYNVHHYFVVPAATYDRQSWRRWLFDQVLKVEQHEACEFFMLAQDAEVAGVDFERLERPYAPVHAPGHDPYTIRELATDEERRTSFRGVLAPAGDQ